MKRDSVSAYVHMKRDTPFFSFSSYVYYITRGFIASARAFNLISCAFNLATRAFSLLTRGFELVTRS